MILIHWTPSAWVFCIFQLVQNWVREKECIYRLPKTSVGLQTQLISPMCYHLVFAAADRRQCLQGSLCPSGCHPVINWMSRRKAICSKIFSVDWFPWCRHPHHCCFQATLETSLNRVGRRRTQSALHTSKEPTQPTRCTSLEPGQTSLQRGRWLQGMARCTPLSWTSCLGIVCCPETWLKGQTFVPYSVAGLLSVRMRTRSPGKWPPQESAQHGLGGLSS